jgi:hypothetical protein
MFSFLTNLNEEQKVYWNNISFKLKLIFWIATMLDTACIFAILYYFYIN